MILILDACTISNLLHVYQDLSLLLPLRKCFDEVYISKEVIAEVEKNKFSCQHLYDSRDQVIQLFADCKLNDYISQMDDDKLECVPFINKFATTKHLRFKDDEGEYFSTLLSLYLSRWGKDELVENNNSVLFATDDNKAQELYSQIFSSNQVGSIIDSIDIIIILHLKGQLSKAAVLKYLQGIRSLYSTTLDEAFVALGTVRKQETDSAKNQSIITSLVELLTDGEIAKIQERVSSGEYKKLCASYPNLKKALKNLCENPQGKKVEYITARYQDVRSNLIWSIDYGEE